MNISKLLTENSDAVFKINKPGQAQFFELQNQVRSMGLKHKGYFVADFDKNEFTAFMKKDVPNGTNIIFLFTESFSNHTNVNEVKDAVAMVKEAGMQAVVVLNTHNNNPGVPNSEISYYSSEKDLLSGLESMFGVNLSTKNDISKNIEKIMNKVDVNTKESKKNKMR